MTGKCEGESNSTRRVCNSNSAGSANLVFRPDLHGALRRLVKGLPVKLALPLLCTTSAALKSYTLLDVLAMNILFGHFGLALACIGHDRYVQTSTPGEKRAWSGDARGDARVLLEACRAAGGAEKRAACACAKNLAPSLSTILL